MCGGGELIFFCVTHLLPFLWAGGYSRQACSKLFRAQAHSLDLPKCWQAQRCPRREPSGPPGGLWLLDLEGGGGGPGPDCSCPSVALKPS